MFNRVFTVRRKTEEIVYEDNKIYIVDLSAKGLESGSISIFVNRAVFDSFNTDKQYNIIIEEVC